MFTLMNWIEIPYKFNYNFSKIDYTFNRRKETVMANKSYTKSFSYLKDCNTNRCIYLNEPITFQISIDSDGVYYSNEEYNIYAYGKNQKEAEQDIFNEFELQYKEYAMEDDKNLDKNARQLKQKLLNIYGEENA